MAEHVQKSSTLHRRLLYASQSSDLQVSSASYGSLAACPSTQRNAVLEPSGTAIVFMVCGSLDQPGAAFSLESCFIDPLSERFLPDIAWSIDGKFLCALTTHGQIFILTDTGNVSRHFPGPLVDPSQFSGQLPVSFSPIPDGRLLVLTADANTFSIDLQSGRCVVESRFRRGFRVGRAISYHAPSETLLVVADGRAAAAAAPGTHCATTRTPSIAAWSLKSRSSPRLLASVKGARTDTPTARELWRAQVSPDGRILGVCESGGWSLLAGPDAKFQPLQVQREDAGDGVAVASLAWEDETSAVVGWGDGRVFRLDLDAMTSFYVPMRDAGLTLEEGAQVAWAFAGGSGAAADASAVSQLTALEPAWEDGADIAEGQHYTGTAEEMADRKGVPIPHKFGVARRIIGWRVSALQETSAEELIEQMLPVGSRAAPAAVDRALAAAQSAGLPPAQVWRRVWAASAQHAADVDRVASAVSGDAEGVAWLEREALGLAGASSAAAVSMLSHALAAQETGELREVLAAAGVGLQGSAAARTAVARLGLLYRLDMARTYAAVHGANADVVGLREFVAAGPLAVAAGFAVAGDVAALETMLARHACSIGGAGALEALAQLPDTAEPALYVPLLQRLLQSRPDAASAAEREADMVEQPAAVAALAGVLQGQHEVTERFRVAEVELEGGDGGAIVTPEAADAWVAERMMEIDDRTGMLARAAALAKAWFAHAEGPPARELVGVHIMHTLFRNIHVLDATAAEGVAALSLRDFLGMTEMAQARCVLQACFPEAPTDLPRGAELISRVAAPALSALPAREQTLANVLQLEFPSEPRWTVAAARCDLHADCALFGGLASLSSAALRLAKSFIPDKTPTASGQWASLLLLLDAVLSEVRAAKLPIDGDQREYFRVRLEEAGDLVRAARVFSRHGMHLMPCVLTASDRSSVSGLLRGLLMNATAAAATSGDTGMAFARLWNDLRDLHMYVFEGQGLSLAYLLREFLRATLLAQQWEVAERHLDGNTHVQLSPQGVARTLSSAAREMFTAAAELSTADPALAACVHCLALRADRNAELQRSLDLVQALRIASSELAVPIDPAAWAPYVFTLPEIFTLANPMTASATSLGSPPTSPTRAHTEAGLAVLSGMMQQLLADSVAAAAAAPLTYYPPLCELIQLLYGSGAPPEGTTKADQQAAWLQVVWMVAGAPGGRDAATEIGMGLVREGYVEMWPVALHLTELPGTGDAVVSQNQELAAFALQHCDAASMPKCIAAATAANEAAAAAAAREGDGAEEGPDEVGEEMPGGAAVAERALKGGLEALEAAARTGNVPAAAVALKQRALACLDTSAAAGRPAQPPRAASQAAVACLFELLMQEGPGSLHAFVEECGALERPERALAAAAAAAALYVLRCANGELQPATLQLSQGPLVSAARNAASASQADSGAVPGSLAEATALLDSLVSARETAARGTELDQLVQMLSGTAGVDMAADEILQEVCKRFAGLEFGHACAIAEYFSAGGPCPLAGPAAGELSALELHPAAMHAILHTHEEVAAAAARDLPVSVAAARALLRTWLAVQPLLGAHAAGGWLLGDLDVDGATALEAAEVIIGAEHEGGVGAAAEAAAAQALLRGVGVHAVATHFPGVLAALEVEEAAWDDVTGDAIVAAVEQRVAEASGELSAECVGDAADAGAAMQALHDLVAALDGPEAAAVPCCERARQAVTAALLRMQQELPAAALAAPVMHEVIALQEALAQPGRWGSSGDTESMGVLSARARATLGVAWPGTEPLDGRDIATAASAEGTLLALLERAEADQQVLAVFAVLRDVLEFGGVFGGGSMAAAATGVVSALARRGRCADAANVLRLCGDAAADVGGVKQALEAAAGPWCASAVAAASGHAALREWAVEKLMHAPVDALRDSGELGSAALLGLLLWGLAECGGKEAARLWQREEVGSLIFDAVGVLPVLEEDAGSEALGLPGLAARLTAEAGYAGGVIAWEAVAKYVGMHPALRTPEGLLANLGRYLAATEARLHLCGAVMGHVGSPYVAGVLVKCGPEYSGIRDWLTQAQAVVDEQKQEKF